MSHDPSLSKMWPNWTLSRYSFSTCRRRDYYKINIVDLHTLHVFRTFWILKTSLEYLVRDAFLLLALMGVWVDHLIPQWAEGHVRPLKPDKKSSYSAAVDHSDVLPWVKWVLFCEELFRVSPEGRRRASPFLVSSNSHQTVATTRENPKIGFLADRMEEFSQKTKNEGRISVWGSRTCSPLQEPGKVSSFRTRWDHTPKHWFRISPLKTNTQ